MLEAEVSALRQAQEAMIETLSRLLEGHGIAEGQTGAQGTRPRVAQSDEDGGGGSVPEQSPPSDSRAAEPGVAMEPVISRLESWLEVHLEEVAGRYHKQLVDTERAELGQQGRLLIAEAERRLEGQLRRHEAQLETLHGRWGRGFRGEEEEEVHQDGEDWEQVAVPRHAAISNQFYSSRYGHTVNVFNRKMYVVGGRDEIGNYYGDIWESGDGEHWFK